MLRTYAQLLRLPNVFTAWADVVMGWMVAFVIMPSPPPWALSWSQEAWPGAELALLLACSGCLYCAGMVWNDFFDVAQDQRERPHRPIPSGRISRATAGWIGAVLMVLGLGFAASVRLLPHATSPVIFAFWLIVFILLYNAWLKRTSFGSVAMGICRFLNVQIGMSSKWYPPSQIAVLPGACLLLALVIGLYVVGVTWFARKEATVSSRRSLLGATCVMGMSILIAFSWPVLGNSFAAWEWSLPPLFLVVWCVIIALPITCAIHDPSPQRVQAAVKTCILGLIGLDAILAFGVVGWPGLPILVLLIPALVLGRWVYST